MTTAPGARRWLVYMLLMTALSSLMMGVIAIEYSNYVVRKNNQQWCEIVKTLDNGYNAPRPTPSPTQSQSPAGKHLAEEFHRLRTDFKCGN